MPVSFLRWRTLLSWSIQIHLSLSLVPAALEGAAAEGPAGEYQRRVKIVTGTPGFVALWDFVRREQGGEGRFEAHQPAGARFDFRLDAVNYVRDYWGEGRAASYDDLPLLGRGPFGDAVEIREEKEIDFRPCLLAPRARLHGSGLDVKGPGRSVSMMVWLVRRSGNHAIAGIWHEGTDLPSPRGQIVRVERGRRQYALFAGLAANSGAAAAHVSENGASSFGDKYARNLSVTREVIPAVSADATGGEIDAAWTAAGFVFDNRRNTVTSYFNGEAGEYWIDNPRDHPFYRWAYRGWLQAKMRRAPGLQEGEDPLFPAEQFYEPPEKRILNRTLVAEQDDLRVELRRYEFTEVRVTLRKDRRGKFRMEGIPDLVRLKVNPYWFPHDLFTPPGPEEGGPFTIGRVIHTSRSIGFTGYIGGVAVFGRALSGAQMRRLSAIGTRISGGVRQADLLEAAAVSRALPRTP